MGWTGFGSLESKAARRRWPLSLGHGAGVSLMSGPTIVSEAGATWVTTLRPSSGPLAEYGTSPGRMPDKPARRDQPLQPLTLQAVAVGASPPPTPGPPFRPRLSNAGRGTGTWNHVAGVAGPRPEAATHPTHSVPQGRPLNPYCLWGSPSGQPSADPFHSVTAIPRVGKRSACTSLGPCVRFGLCP